MDAIGNLILGVMALLGGISIQVCFIVWHLVDIKEILKKGK